MDIHIAIYINPPTTTSVKISQNVDILAKVGIISSALKSQTLSNRSKFTGQNELTVFDR